MDINKTIAILEALASGCAPATGELIHNESVLNEREVIRALQMAIDQLKKEAPQIHIAVEIDEVDIKAAIQLLQDHSIAPTYSRLTGFFLATRTFKNDLIISNGLYGKYKSSYQKGQLLDFFTAYLSDNGYSRHGKRISKLHENNPCRAIDFFRNKTFQNLSELSITQLKERVQELGVHKIEHLSEYIKNVRINYPRSYEAWTHTEKKLLIETLQYTNDLELLSECFQRGKGAIESCGQQLIYENQNSEWQKPKLS